MTQIKTRPELLAALTQAATLHLSAREVHQQRVSFAMSSFKDGNTPTREKVEEVIAQQDGFSPR